MTIQQILKIYKKFHIYVVKICFIDDFDLN